MLTKEALLERRKGIGGSDAAKIVSGDWFALWQDKTGKVDPEDLSGVFAVQLGIATEVLNLNWVERLTGDTVQNRGVVVKHSDDTVLRCTLDGQLKSDDTVVQAKHVNGFSKIDEVRARYTPQVLHEMLCCGVRRGILSVIIGTSEPVLELIEMDDFWANEYIDKCAEFWKYVETDTAPPQGAPVEPPPIPTLMRVVSMEGNNAWASAAADWGNHQAAAKLFEAAQKDLKSMVEPDVREAAGHGVKITRSKAGSLLIKKEK